MVNVHYDSYNSGVIIPRISSSGIECIAMPQTAQHFNEPLKYFEKQIYDENIVLDNPVLRWNIRNVVIYEDGNANIKILKNKSADSVDGMVSLGEAFKGYLLVNHVEQERNDLEQWLKANSN